jgi:two-component system chemotaxis response regulator CheY
MKPKVLQPLPDAAVSAVEETSNRPKILVADEARLVRNILKRILTEEIGCSVVEAQDGGEAVETYKLHRPDAAVLDIMLEGLNGVDAAKSILAFDPDANIVMTASMGQERLLGDCLFAGVRDFILKPFTRGRILNAVSLALRRGGAGAPAGTEG